MAGKPPQHLSSRASKNTLRPKKRFINYPRRNQRGLLRWLPSFRLWLGIFATGIFAIAVTLFVTYQVLAIPKPDNVAVAQTSTVYFSDGTTPVGRFSAVNRVVIPASKIPTSMKNAIVASEDSTFYTNNGVDLRGIARAVVNNVQGKKQQGASTITMQYIENYYLGSNKSYLGKVKEALLAYKIEKQADKDTILSSYLNTIYFGRSAYGIQQAAKMYFGKDAESLTPSECALLAGIVPAPSAYDPAIDPGTAKLRWNRVLDRMVELKMMDAATRSQAQFPATITFEPEQTYVGTNGYLMRLVHDELRNKVGLSEDQIAQGGLRVVTTLDQKTQSATVAAVNDLGPRPAGNHVGITSVDPNTGGVLALYGGPDYLKQPNNNSTQAIMQAGSTFKTFALAAAIEAGKTLADRFPGNSNTRVEGWIGADGSNRVPNDEDESMGSSVSLLTATTHSLNSAFAQLNVDIGPVKTKEAAIKAGVPSNTVGLNDTISNVLGTAAPHVLDMASAYATFAAQGVHFAPHLVTIVQDPLGPVYSAAPKPTQAFSAETANTVTYALRQVINSGTATRALDLGRPEAGKTGTSDQSSIWFAGYTPQISTAVSMYQTDEKGNPTRLVPFGKYTRLYGNTYPIELWLKVQRAFVDDKPATNFTAPPDKNIYGGSDGNSGTANDSGDQNSNRHLNTDAPATSDSSSPSTEPTTNAESPTPLDTSETSPGTPSSAPEPSASSSSAPDTGNGRRPQDNSQGNGNGNGNGNGKDNRNGNGNGNGKKDSTSVQSSDPVNPAANPAVAPPANPLVQNPAPVPSVQATR